MLFPLVSFWWSLLCRDRDRDTDRGQQKNETHSALSPAAVGYLQSNLAQPCAAEYCPHAISCCLSQGGEKHMHSVPELVWALSGSAKDGSIPGSEKEPADRQLPDLAPLLAPHSYRSHNDYKMDSDSSAPALRDHCKCQEPDYCMWGELPVPEEKNISSDQTVTCGETALPWGSERQQELLTHQPSSSEAPVLRHDSNHPKPLKRNIPTGQFLRLRRNCSKSNDFETKAEIMKKRFLERGLYSTTHTRKEYKIKYFINCSTTHVVCMLKCPCGFVYIGQMKRALKLRIDEHKTAICTRNMDYVISRHYVNANHGLPSTLKFWGI
ncbi:unnamed protein product [Coregonus sp. 'balchen']|nr:unnamed protein product [Coregonus sp. 'balchen']